MIHPNPVPRPCSEALEARRLLSVSTFHGTQGPDAVHIGRLTHELTYFVDLNGQRIAQGEWMPDDPDRAIIMDLLAGDDLLTVSPDYAGKLLIYGGAGNDTLIGGNAAESLFGQHGDDSLVGNGGPDLLVGGDGDDTIHGGKGADKIYGDGYGINETDLAGNDLLFGDDGNDLIEGGPGHDRLEGGPGDDRLMGGFGKDSLFGGEGDDILILARDIAIYLDGGRSNIYDPGRGFDTLEVYSNRPISLSADGIDNDGVADERSHIGNFNVYRLEVFEATAFDASQSPFGVLVSVHGVVGTGQNTSGPFPPAVTLIGSEHADEMVASSGGFYITPLYIEGLGGRDLLEGGVGSDTIHGGTGNDTIRGGAGDDLLIGGGGRDFIDGQWGNDSLFGHAGNDTLFGGENDDELDGGSGDDSLRGDDGDDSMFGQGGNDSLDGGLGSDLFHGGSGSNWADYSRREEDLSLTLDRIANDGAPGENDNIHHTVRNVQGGRGNDFIRGDRYANVLLGNGGRDTIHGGSGNDTISGGLGKDLIFGESGNDFIFSRDGLRDTVNGGSGFDIADPDEFDLLHNLEELI